MGKPSTKAQNKYIAKKYDRLSIAIPKGKKEEFSAYAKSHQISITKLILDAVAEKIERDGLKDKN